MTILFFSVFANVCHQSEAGQLLEDQGRGRKINRAVIRGIALLYDWEFEAAEDLFQKVIAEKPGDPIGYFYSAMVTYSRIASGFWTSENVRTYENRIDKAISVARIQIRNQKADSFTYFYLGGALGFEGRVRLMERKWVSSFFLAVEAIEALRTCLEMDPLNRDVLFGLGIFDYYTARLSGVLKFLSYLLLHEGNRKEGLRKLHIAATEATYSSIEAKSLLIHIYLFLEKGEQSYQKALPLAEDLSMRFRKNPRYYYLRGLTYIRLGANENYRGMVDLLCLKEKNARSNKMALIWCNRVAYLEAAYFLFNEKYQKARDKLDLILSRADPVNDPAMIAWPLLKKGMICDIEEKRATALGYYKRIMEMDNGAGAQFLAQKYRDNPAKKGDPFLGY
ncbi:MAG: hypothetical protein JRJ85_16130 [Deltaproteobacteria bacterium]|nr:hypothetical protein [Deltaproteobacteria bacterium]